MTDYVEDITSKRRYWTLRIIAQNKHPVSTNVLRRSLNELGFTTRLLRDEDLFADAEFLCRADLAQAEYPAGTDRLLDITRRGRSYLDGHVGQIPGISNEEI